MIVSILFCYWGCISDLGVIVICLIGSYCLWTSGFCLPDDSNSHPQTWWYRLKFQKMVIFVFSLITHICSVKHSASPVSPKSSPPGIIFSPSTTLDNPVRVCLPTNPQIPVLWQCRAAGNWESCYWFRPSCVSLSILKGWKIVKRQGHLASEIEQNCNERFWGDSFWCTP